MAEVLKDWFVRVSPERQDAIEHARTIMKQKNPKIRSLQNPELFERLAAYYLANEDVK